MLPDFRAYAVPAGVPGSHVPEPTRVLGGMLRDVMRLNDAHQNFRIFGPDETESNRLNAVLEVTGKDWRERLSDVDQHLARDGRVVEMLSEHMCQGWLEGYLLKVSRRLPWRRPVASLNYLLTSHVWRQDHNGFSHQDPGFIDHVMNKKAEVIRVYLPPEANTVGHRIVHGGSRFSSAVLIDDQVLADIASLASLAPLHQPRAIAGIEAVRAALPGVPAIACFDTAFHSGLPAAAATYALPKSWTRAFTLRRYGFHGLSHAYASRRARRLLGLANPSGLRMVTCHLGAGSSLAAVRDGASIDTTMGFTPLEGLVMASRCGSVDPGLVVWLLQHSGLALEDIAAGLEESSGLAGLANLSTGSGDMRDVRRAAEEGQADARLAIEVHAHRLRREIAAMAAAMDGLDALVFTGGIGEHQPAVRAEAAAGLGFLGVRIDQRAHCSAETLTGERPPDQPGPGSYSGTRFLLRDLDREAQCPHDLPAG